MIARSTSKDQAAARRARTRRLIELGGLVHKSGLTDRLHDDRAALYGALLTLVDLLDSPERQTAMAVWRRRGRRRFDSDDQSPD